MDTLIWLLAAIVVALIVLQVFLGTVAPKQFWRNLDDRNQTISVFLWGFSHPFGPYCKVGQPVPWEQLKE